MLPRICAETMALKLTRLAYPCTPLLRPRLHVLSVAIMPRDDATFSYHDCIAVLLCVCAASGRRLTEETCTNSHGDCSGSIKSNINQNRDNNRYGPQSSLAALAAADTEGAV